VFKKKTNVTNNVLAAVYFLRDDSCPKKAERLDIAYTFTIYQLFRPSAIGGRRTFSVVA